MNWSVFHNVSNVTMWEPSSSTGSNRKYSLVSIGICLAVIGAISSGFGMNMLRASSLHHESQRPWYQRPRMLLGGLLVTVLNTMLDMVAFALSPLAIIAPISGVTLVVSLLFARQGCTGVREPVNKCQWLAVALILLGVCIVNICGPQPPPVLDTTLVLSNFHNISFQWYEMIATAVVGATYVGLLVEVLPSKSVYTAATTAVAAGMCSGMCQTLLKVLATLIAAYYLHETTPFIYHEFWQGLALLVMIGLVLFHMLNLCMSSAPMAVASPFYQSSVMLFTIACSSSFFGELMHTEKNQLSWFAVGLTNVLVGLGLLVINSQTKTHNPQRLSAIEDEVRDEEPKEPKESSTIKTPIRPEWDDEDL